jgi:hypothetical protein
VILNEIEEVLAMDSSIPEEFTRRRPAADAGARPATYGDCYIVNKQKDERTGGHFEEAHRDIVMYLAPNSNSKDAHWFYKPETDRVVSRRSYDRVSGIPSAWMNGKREVGTVYDEDGNKWDFVNGPQQYDVWHLGATAEAVAMEPKAKYPLPNNSIIDKPTSLNNIIGAQHQQTELQVLAPENDAYETCVTLQEVPMASTVEEVPTPDQPMVEVELVHPPTSDVGPIGSRTRSTGPAEEISIKTINENPYYGLSSEQYGKIFLIFYYHVHIFLKNVFFAEGPIFCFGIRAEEVDMWVLKAPYSASVSGLRK